MHSLKNLAKLRAANVVSKAKSTWLREKKVYFCLRLKKNNFVELESENWWQLKHLGLKPGISFYLRGVKMTKSKQVDGFDLAAKWQKKRYGLT